MNTLHIRSEEELPEVAEALLAALGDRRVVVLRGEMGAGKTTLVRAVAEPNAAGHRIYHFDFYRIDTPAEAYDLGYEEYFYSGDLCLVEWPEKIEELLPDDVMTVRIEVDGETSRTFRID